MAASPPMPQRGRGRNPSAFGEIAPEILIKSDWARHEATFFARGGYVRLYQRQRRQPPDRRRRRHRGVSISARAGTLNLAERYHFDTESLVRPGLPGGGHQPPGVHDIDGLAVTRPAARADACSRFSGFADRTRSMTNGTFARRWSSTRATATTRFSRAKRPGRLRGHAGPDTVHRGRLHGSAFFDQTVDDNGLSTGRASGPASAFGVAFMMSRPILKAELALGYLPTDFDDPILRHDCRRSRWTAPPSGRRRSC